MKRYLKQNRHSLSDWEKENTWLAIGKAAGSGPASRRSSRGAFRPALAVSALAAVLIVVVAGWFGISGSQKSIVARDAGVVMLPPEVGTDSMDVRDPAQDARATQERSEAQAQTRAEKRGREKSAPVLVDEEAAADEIGPIVGDNLTATMPAQGPAPVAAQQRSAAPAPALHGVLLGVVVDAGTGEGLVNAVVRLRGTSRQVFTGEGGHFELTGLEAGRSYELEILYLGYEAMRMQAVARENMPTPLRVGLVAKIVEQLQAFDVEGEEYRVEIKSAVTEHKVSSETFQKYAIDKVEEALSKQAGIVPRAGELGVRGGRSGPVGALDDVRSSTFSLDRPTAPAPMGSVTGGTKPPNGEQLELMYFEHAGVNPFIDTEEDSLSTFAVDVDNASWTLARSYLQRDLMPPQDAIRVEEFVNAFDAGWPRHTDDAFRIHVDGAPSRFGKGLQLVRIGLVGRTVDDSRRKPANLVFVIDVSGSMNRENRLGLVKRSLRVLLDELREGDRVGIVVYGSQGRVLLQPTDISRREVIESAIDALGPGGSTNAFEGLDLAYDMARQSYEAGKLNRLILCSDGVANHGATTEAEQMLKRIRSSSDEGITLSTIGFGMGNYNDVLMEKLADQGDGNYYYVDEFEEAERVFRENLTGLLQTIARETKVQVAFDPERVERWRLLGYENRDVADRDFRNDAVDAGEVGAGHQVTALYEVKLTDGALDGGSGSFGFDDVPLRRDEGTRLGEVRLRWEAPAHDTAHAGEVTEIAEPIRTDDLADEFSGGSIWLRTQAVVAEFAEILRGSYWAKESRLADLVPVADALAADSPGDAQLRELADLVRIAARLESDAAGETGPGVGEVPPED